MSGYSGRAEAIHHAGEILQGALRLGDRTEPFLVTLPAPSLRTEAIVQPATRFQITPASKTKALRAAQLACAHWQLRQPLSIRIQSHIPIARGFGSSTADCVAVVRAIANLAGQPVDPAIIATLVHQSESAADSTMFDAAPLAFFHRSGRVHSSLADSWPSMHITVIDLGGPPVETLDCPTPNYAPSELATYAVLLAELRHAIQSADVPTIGRIATRSALMHQHHRPHPQWPSVHAAAIDAGACGVAIAHSGSIAAAISAFPLSLPSIATYTLGPSRKGAHHADSVGRRR